MPLRKWPSPANVFASASGGTSESLLGASAKRTSATPPTGKRSSMKRASTAGSGKQSGAGLADSVRCSARANGVVGVQGVLASGSVFHDYVIGDASLRRRGRREHFMMDCAAHSERMACRCRFNSPVAERSV